MRACIIQFIIVSNLRVLPVQSKCGGNVEKGRPRVNCFKKCQVKSIGNKRVEEAICMLRM